MSPTVLLTALLLIATGAVYLPLWLHTHHLTSDSIAFHGSGGDGGGWLSSSSSSSSASHYHLRQLGSRRRTNAALGHPLSAASSSSSSSWELKALEDRIHYLETKLNSYLAFDSDPFLRLKTPAKCQQLRKIKDLACTKKEQMTPNGCALDNQSVCLDNFPAAPPSLLSGGSTSSDSSGRADCIVYDFGIRESPEYGLAFLKEPFGCEVVGFDPSPISVKWWENKKTEIQAQAQQHRGSYQFQPVGASGTDGTLTLREYDWDQVSILELPQRVVNPADCNSSGGCKYHFHKKQAQHEIPVVTLATAMERLGHADKRITLLKLDVEGSEYMFLERMIDDLSCRQVDQLTLEWHHYDYDTRYGVTSNPQLNVMVALLKDRCGLEQYWAHESTGWPSNQKLYADMGMTLYYTLSSFMRTQWIFEDEEMVEEEAAGGRSGMKNQQAKGAARRH